MAGELEIKATFNSARYPSSPSLLRQGSEVSASGERRPNHSQHVAACARPGSQLDRQSVEPVKPGCSGR